MSAVLESQVFDDDLNDFMNDDNDKESVFEVGGETRIAPEVINIEDLICLTNATSNPIRSLCIEYTHDLLEYPKTHEKGYTYVVQTGDLTAEEVKMMMNDIQYCKSQLHPPKQIFSRQGIQQVEEDITKRNALNFARSIKHLFTMGKACFEASSTCQPIFRRHQQPDITGYHTPFVICINASQNPSAHFYRNTQGHTQLNISFLEEIFESGLLHPTEKCGVMEQMQSHRKVCVNLTNCPYMLFISHGQHKHPPPPPNKPPATIMKRIVHLIKEIRESNMTLSTFLKSPALEAFCHQYNSPTLPEIHQSFTNMDRFRAIIKKQQLLAYSAGQEYNGVRFELERNPKLKEYIQELYHDEEGLMIVCMYKEQAELLLTLSSVEIDMSYKHLKFSQMNEVVFATYLPLHEKIVTLCRVFTEQKSPEGYYHLFKRVFDIVQRLTGKQVTFHYIQGVGLRALIIDMCNKQMAGLARYLAELDPQKHHFSWQLKNIVIFCHVHFFRSISNLVKSENQHISVYNRMTSLLNCKSKEQYMELCDLLIANESKKIQNWAKHKKRMVIAAGLNKFCSLIPHSIYDSVRNHINAAEQIHNKSYAFDKAQALLPAVLCVRKLDKLDIMQHKARQTHGIHHEYRDDNMQAHYQQHITREEILKKRKRTEQASDFDDIFFLKPVEEHQVDEQVASSRRGSSERAESIQSSPSLHRVASANLLGQDWDLQQSQIDIKRQWLELQKMKEELRAKKLANDEKELELIEKRRKLQTE
ncbi:hypothetical protein PAAG_03463 [Paracoccidioides lutzii Pb01]|uniref:MULE transposase domain-containing protein n=1 Tax=Paracoccidioides lutzii (strain ATCC MYA-826 / Pb01) TaxID=502779 RepID=C1GX89_PARBA|nr:hypothetical protein PAAG_03463 [Paracoccidioides lutzii Pb01]EEH41177.2 hypothetical protein PAAG_03463 [Paracoccidioides lutzii Pb01]